LAATGLAAGFAFAATAGLAAGALRAADFCWAGAARFAGAAVFDATDFADAEDFAAFSAAGFTLGLVITNLYVPFNTAPGARTWLPSRIDAPFPTRLGPVQGFGGGGLVPGRAVASRKSA
jgi:hypothetical protein